MEEIKPRITRMTQIKSIFKILIRVFCVNLWLVLTVAAQTPEIIKVDPPSWWVRSSVNPVRLMIRGRNLHDARVRVSPGLRVVGPPKINERGTYLFVDVQVASAGRGLSCPWAIPAGAGRPKSRPARRHSGLERRRLEAAAGGICIDARALDDEIVSALIRVIIRDRHRRGAQADG